MNRMTVKLHFVFLALAVGALSGCNRNVPTATRSTGKRADLYIEVSALGNLEYFFDHKLGMKNAGELLGVQTEYTGPADFDMAAMVAALELAIARKPAGLVVVGFEESLT